MTAIDRRSRSIAIPRRCVVAESVVCGLQRTFADAAARRVEGVAYFLGQTDGMTSCLLAVVPVGAQATFGSFAVASSEIGRVVELADGLGLQIVGQIHSHPTLAYHSEGDDAGAQIRFDGYVSIVVPNYGRQLPSLEDAVSYMYAEELGQFVALADDHFHIIPAVHRQ